MKKRCFFPLLVLLTFNGITFAQDSDGGHEPLSLTLLHLNDTHSNFLSSLLSVTFPPDSVVYRLPVGSVARIATVVDSIRGEVENVLFVHAGDMVQGSLFYTLFGGEADDEGKVRRFGFAKPEAATGQVRRS